MSGAVGSKPALTRSGFPVFWARFSFSASSSSRMISTAPRRMYSICWSTGVVVKSFILRQVQPHDDASALNFASSRQDHIDRFRINSMLFLQNLRRQRFGGVAVQYGDDTLYN